jgi:hypothetical protein
MKDFPISLRLSRLIEEVKQTPHGAQEIIVKLEEFKRTAHTCEQIHIKRFEMAIFAIESGNELFDFFADIYIDKSGSENVEMELGALKAYLNKIMRNHLAPYSAQMDMTWNDNLLKDNRHE